jgi:hypothetical protein
MKELDIDYQILRTYEDDWNFINVKITSKTLNMFMTKEPKRKNHLHNPPYTNI